MSEEQKRYAGTIDLTPSWQGTMRMLIELLTNSTPKGQAEAEKELMRLAAIADGFPQQLAAKDEAMAELAASLQEISRRAKAGDARDKGDEVLARYLGMSPEDVEHAAVVTGADLVLLKCTLDRVRAAKFEVEADTLDFAGSTADAARGFIVKHDGVPVGFFAQEVAPVGFVSLMTEDATARSAVVSSGSIEAITADGVDEVLQKLERARFFVRAAKCDAAADMPPLMKPGAAANAAPTRAR